MSDTAITPVYVKTAGQAGGMKQTLIAIVVEGKGGRVYCHQAMNRHCKPAQINRHGDLNRGNLRIQDGSHPLIME